jgi:hypothetical protein
MENRETVTFESNGRTIIAYTFITAAEARDAKNALFKGVTIAAPEPGVPAARPTIPVENALAFERAQFEKCVVSVDGKPAFDVLDNLPSDEYEAILADIRANLPKVFLVKPKMPDTPSQSSTT